MSTFLELVQDLHRECNIGGTEPSTLVGATGNNARLKNWVLQADLELKGRWFDWKFLWAQKTGTTSAGVSTLTVPADMNVLDKDSFVMNGGYLSVVEYQDYRRYYLNSTDVDSIPSVATVLPSGNIKLQPAPDATYNYSYDYWKLATEDAMSADGDTSVIPAQFHSAILWMAVSYYALWDNAPELEKRAMTMLFGRDPDAGDQGLINKLEASQLPNAGYAHGISSGHLNLEVIAE